ncbi:unnamed protein product, partial [Vitis vinifera]
MAPPLTQRWPDGLDQGARTDTQTCYEVGIYHQASSPPKLWLIRSRHGLSNQNEILSVNLTYFSPPTFLYHLSLRSFLFLFKTMSTTITGSYFPHYDCGTIILNVSAATFTKAQKRWRVAYVAICSFRVLLSLSKQNVMRRKATSTALLHSHLTVDIQPPTSYHHDDQSDLTEMVKEKDLIALRGFGGVEGVAATLLIDPQHGILGNEDDVRRRRDKFGSNTYYKPPPKGLFYFVEGWYEGGSIFVALSKISNNIKIDVARDGRRQEISIFDIVVGDVVFLNIGDQIPADGLFLEGHSMEVDESSMTGESDHVEVDRERNPFLFSGSKVADGYARMLVTSVGMNTAWGEMMSSISRDTNERTPLQARLDKLTSSIGKVGLAVAFLVLVVLLIRYFTGHTKDENGQREYNVAIPEGLPLAVTLTLAYSMKRMMADHAMVRKLSACETMGSATIICTDKTGTLTMNQMKVTNVYRPASGAVFDILHVETFNSEKKRSGVSMRKNADNTIHVHWKGAAEMVLQILRAHQKLNENGLTLLGIVGLKDPCRPGVKRAVEICKSAGVEIKMITGDNVFTAKAIATECGILGSDDTEHKGAVVEGVEFRNYTHEERMQKIDKIRVMARSSPFDKLLMVQCLKQKGEVVAVTGDGTNDAPALKEADIGLSMGIQVPLTAVQLLWVNLIMDTLGALALATDRPTNELMQRPPVGRTEPLITNVMWRNLLAQALYQIAVLLTLQFKGESIFNVDEKVNDTLIFNTFVLCQVFNEFNARKLEKQNKFADTVNLNGLQWAICIAIAAVSWPIGWIVKFIPVSDTPFLSSEHDATLATKKRHNFAHALGMNGPEGLVFNRGALRYTHQPVHGTTKT